MSTKNENATVETVTLQNGFQRGQWVRFLTNVDGKWTVVKTVSTGECTWVGDEKVNGLEVRLEGRGIGGGYYGVSALSSVNTTPFIFGFTEEELAAPAPEKGYTVKCLGVRTKDWEEVLTLRDYLIAKFSNESFHAWTEKGDGIVEMPYRWGDQASASFALVLNGELVDSITGCGDRTPILTESVEKCMADRKIYHTDEMTEWMKKVHAEENRVLDAINQGNSEKWRAVKNHLLSSYRVGQNPLPTLRKKYGGEWRYYAPGIWQGDVGDGTVIFHEINKLEESSNGWTVVYTPSKK